VPMKVPSIGSPPVAGRTREGKAVAVRSGISRKFFVIFKTFNVWYPHTVVRGFLTQARPGEGRMHMKKNSIAEATADRHRMQRNGRRARTAIIAAMVLDGFLCLGTPAQSAVIETLEQVGTNVVAIGTGTIDLRDLTPQSTNGGLAPILVPTIAELTVGNSPGYLYNFYTGISGPSSFGSSANAKFGTSGDGSVLGIYAAGIYVPINYTSGGPLAGTATWANQTLDSLGVTPGTYVWTWGTGPDADSFTLEIGVASTTTPLPAALPLFATGLGVMGLLGWRRKRKGAANVTAA
jgi:hypothetical protein